MNSLSRAPVLSFLPGGLLLLASALLLNFLLPLPSSYLQVQFGFYIVLCAGVLLSWRFRSTRVLFSLLVLLLVQEAAFGPSYVTADHLRVLIAAFLLPVNFLVFSLLPERGFTLDALVPRAALLLIDFVALGISSELHGGRGRVFVMPWSATALWAITLLFFLLRALFYRRNLESGFFWGVLAAWLALRNGGVGVEATTYLGAGALVLSASLIESFYFMAYHDELTGLPSRRAFNEALTSLAPPYSIAVVDIDHFKSFNDLYGHDTGDEVLRMVATRLAQVSGGGQAFRCGGEEFAIIFRDRPATDALAHLEELRQEIEKCVFRLRGPDRRQQIRGSDRRESTRRAQGQRKPKRVPASPSDITAVTVSIGVAEPEDKQRAPQQVIAAADKALYRAKAGGRNRVQLAGAPASRKGKLVAASRG